MEKCEKHETEVFVEGDFTVQSGRYSFCFTRISVSISLKITITMGIHRVLPVCVYACVELAEFRKAEKFREVEELGKLEEVKEVEQLREVGQFGVLE